jgi:hypothetical protein
MKIPCVGRVHNLGLTCLLYSDVCINQFFDQFKGEDPFVYSPVNGLVNQSEARPRTVKPRPIFNQAMECSLKNIALAKTETDLSRAAWYGRQATIWANVAARNV